MLLNDYAHRQNYEVVREVFTMGTRGAKVRPDGILKNLWGIEIGLWESKDEKDDIEAEIDAKQKKVIRSPIFCLKTRRQQSCFSAAKW